MQTAPTRRGSQRSAMEVLFTRIGPSVTLTAFALFPVAVLHVHNSAE